MISTLRVVGTALVVLATACSAAPDSSPAPGDPQSSADELNKARFTSLKKPTDKDLAALYAAGDKLDNRYLGVYKFNKPTDEATNAESRSKRIKEVMHRYMCGFFDESIDIGPNNGPNAAKAAMNDLDLDNNASDQEAKVKAFETALGPVLANRKLDLLSGSASGNNTMGEVMGVYDTAHNEILFFGFTNCGSDD